MKPEIAELIERLRNLAEFEAENQDCPLDSLPEWQAAAALEEAYKPIDDAEVQGEIKRLQIMHDEIAADLLERLARNLQWHMDWYARNKQEKRDLQAEIERLKESMTTNGEGVANLLKQRDQALWAPLLLNRDLSISIEKNDQLQAAIDQECKWNWFEDGIVIADHVHSLEQAYKQGREEVIKNLKQFATKPASQEEARKAGSKARLQEIAEVATKPEKCEHGKGIDDYCEPCGRIHGG